jgi:hypothetical protein
MTMHAASRAPMPGGPEADDNQYPPGTSLMTAAGLHELRLELERLRHETRDQIEQRLRESRPYGEGSNNGRFRSVRLVSVETRPDNDRKRHER